MKLLILSFYYEPDLCAGSFRTTSLVKALIKKASPNTEVEVITTLPNRYSSFSEAAPSFEAHDNLTIHRIALPSHKSGMRDQAKAFTVFARQAYAIARKSDYEIVFATSSRLMTALLGAVFAWKQRAKLYLDIRDIFVDTLNDVLPQKVSWLSTPALSLLERFAFWCPARVNLVSAGFKEYFEARYPKLKYQYFTNGIDEEFISAAAHAADREEKPRKTILYAGNIGEGQGLHKILPPLASQLSDCNVMFKVIGDGGRREALAQAFEEHGCRNYELLPPVSREQLIKEYLSADVLFLHLNDYDAFLKVLPSKVFEYGALGKPVWAGVAGYAAEFINANVSNSAVFPPCDAKAAIQGFEALDIRTTPRNEFISKFSRQNIMDEMADDILSLESRTNYQ